MRDRRKGGSRSIDFRKWAWHENREPFLACMSHREWVSLVVVKEKKERKRERLPHMCVHIGVSYRHNSQINVSMF